MNKAYRLIWSRAKEAWIVVAEKIKGNGGPAPVTVALLASLLLAAGNANALPTGAQIVSGSAGIVTSGSTMTITNSANAIINWQGFSIGSSETTRFVQPSALSAVLNRVTGGNPSQILGTLQSNGKVLLINPSGIIFGSGARVDVNGLIASSLDLSNQDFLAGKMKFSAGAIAGKVENQGVITTPSGGQVYLIAPDVTNSGVINAPNGSVLLAAGKEVLLVDSTNPEIALVVTAPDGQSLNLGTIVADAGRVGMYGSIVRHQGRISADSAVQDASGRIFFKATKEVTLSSGSITTANGPTGGTITAQAIEGTTLVSGTMEAKGSNGTGGTVQILGQYAGLIDSASIDASGTSGGGTVLVGGDYQGKNPEIQNAIAIYMGKDTLIKADATDNGNGGKVILWSGNATRAYGSISVKGGANGGDGGFVETSGKQFLDYRGLADLRAPKGKAGTLLLDPSDIEIGNAVTTLSLSGSSPDFTYDGGTSTSQLLYSDLQNQLALGNVTVSTSTGTGGTGDITVANSVSWSSSSTLTLDANHSIYVNSSISGANGMLTLNAATGNIQQDVTAPITANRLNITAYWDVLLADATNAVSKLKATSTAGSIYFKNGGTLQLDLISALDTSSGGASITTTSSGDITVAGLVSAHNNVSLTSAGNITQTGGGLITASSLSASAETGIGTLATPLQTKVSTLSASNSSSGGVYINNAGTLSVTGSIYASLGDVYVAAAGAASDININQMAQVTGENVILKAGRDVVVTGGSVYATANMVGDATVIAGRDVKVAGISGYDGSIKAAHDVKITATTGKLYMTSDGSTAANVIAEYPSSIYLNLPGQSSGGYVIDGIEGGSTVSGTNPSTGLFVLGTTPAVVGSTLWITYAAPVTGALILPNDLNNSLDSLPTSPVASIGLEQVTAPDDSEDNDKDKEKENGTPKNGEDKNATATPKVYCN